MADQRGAEGGGQRHANRDRSDIKGSPRRPAEEQGTTGSGRSPSNPPAPGRNTRESETVDTE